MKRAHLQRVKPVEYSPSQVEGSVERQDQVGNGVKRKKRTSAAMIGLALSMGASSLLVPRQNEGATAAEPTPTDAATLSLVPSISAAPAATMIEHVVVKGQTLWQLAQKYQVSVEAIAAANSLKVSDVVRVGQTLRIPATATEAQAAEAKRSVEFSTVRSPQQVASADLNSLPIANAQTSAEADVARVEAAQTQRNASLDRLRQQQEKLRRSLAELKTKDQAAKAEASSLSEAAKPESPAIASSPSQSRDYQTQSSEAASTVTLSNSGSGQSLIAASNVSTPDWLRTNQALTVPSTVTPGLITQVPSPASAARIAHQPTERPKVQQVAANPRPEMVSYQVNLGDTVAEIASAHNISPSTLVQANRISDPNFIFVGQILRVPATQAMAAVPRPRQAAPSQQVAARLSVVPTTATALINPAPVAQPSAGTGGTLPTPSLPAPSMSGRDPHVETLLSEIKVLRERHRTATQALAATPSTPAPVAVQVAASNLPTPSISTQFNPGGLNAVQAPELNVRAIGQPTVQPTVQSTARISRSQVIPVQVPAAERPQASAPAPQPQLVAAAPAGAESYAPLLQPVTGRLVSPDLPPLQGEDSFLPEGSPSFNGYLWPAKGLLTSGYGWRWGRMHAGIDIAADVGTPIFAAADGVVETSEWNSGGYGNMIDVRHADGSMTRYGHLNRSLVQPGQKVKQGEQIAEMGSTGYSTGPHLHFEVHPANGDGGAVDPIAYLPAK